MPEITGWHRAAGWLGRLASARLCWPRRTRVRGLWASSARCRRCRRSVGFADRRAALLVDVGSAEAAQTFRAVAEGSAARRGLAGRGHAVRPARRRGRARPHGRRRGARTRGATAVAPALRRGEPLSLGAAQSRNARRGPPRAGEAARSQRVEFFERVPADRWYEAFVDAGRSPAIAGRRELVLDDAARSHAAPAGRGDARRLRRQCEPRVAHAARRAARASSRRCRARRATTRSPRAVSRHHAGAGEPHGAADRRPAVAVAHRAQGASCGPTPRSISRRSCARSSTGCRRSRATAASRSRSSVPAEALRGARRSRRVAPRVREPGRERTQICRLRQAGRHHARGRRRPGARRASRCATMAPASRPSTCRG